MGTPNPRTVKHHLTLLLGCILGLFSATGCRQSSSEHPIKEPPITGRRSDPPTELKADWKPGQRYVMHLDSTHTAEIGFGRQPTSQETTISLDYAVAVTNAAAGGRGLEMEIRGLAVDSHNGDRNVYHFDSLNKAVPNQGPGVEMLQRLIGGRIWFLMDSSNHVAQVEGIKALMERAQGDLGAGAQDQRRNWMSGLMERVFNPDYFSQMIETGTLPASATRIGDTWTHQREIDVGLVGRLVVCSTNTLRGWQEHAGKRCARIEFKGTLALKTGQAEGPLAFIGLTLQDGQVSGRSWFDPAVGLPVETVLDQSCSVSGSMPNFGRRNNPQGTNTGPQRFSFPWRQTVSTSLVVVEPAEPVAPGK
jgi:hypothetical protein